MDRIVLKAEDFDRLDIPCTAPFGDNEEGTGQYCNPEDCPVARALIRQGFEYDAVGVNTVFVDYEDVSIRLRFDGTLKNVERCREELLAGAKEAYIEITLT